MRRDVFKLVILILFIILLILIWLYSIFGFSFSLDSVSKIKENRKEINNIFKEIKINNSLAVLDIDSNTYLYNIPEKYEGKKYILKLDLPSGYKYKILNSKMNLVKVKYLKPLYIIIFNDDTYFKIKMYFTNLPVLSIDTEDMITTEDTISTLHYGNSDTNNKYEKFNTKIHIRGSSSKASWKKSYRVDIYNEDYSEEIKINLSNFYNGSSFILDSLYKDPSKVRNLLSTEIWNEVSNDFSNVDIHSEFVELFINNRYEGLYLFTEPINRTKLDLNKNSAIVKTINYELEVKQFDFSNIKENVYLGYEIKYPDNINKYSDVWKYILSKTSLYYNKEYANNYDLISKTWNLDNYIDMIIFNYFTNNNDNCLLKNNYFYTKDLTNSLIYIQPWDMEFTFGIAYDPSNYIGNKKVDIYHTKESMIFYHESAPEINKLLIDRYWELRDTALNKKHICKLIDEYVAKLNKGAAIRDSKRWHDYNIDDEADYIKEWLDGRIKYLDKYVSEMSYE